MLNEHSLCLREKQFPFLDAIESLFGWLVTHSHTFSVSLFCDVGIFRPSPTGADGYGFSTLDRVWVLEKNIGSGSGIGTIY